MRYASVAGITGVGAATLAIAIAQALAQSPSAQMKADEISGALRGMICTTKAGAKFTFTNDGHYTYAGLWENDGHYAVGDGAITVALDNGLERNFAISRRGDVLYIEHVAISCGPFPEPIAKATAAK